MILRMNLTTLNAPGSKNGSLRAIEFNALWRRERVPPVKSSMTFARDHPTVLYLL